jgi:hypothetical protein
LRKQTIDAHSQTGANREPRTIRSPPSLKRVFMKPKPFTANRLHRARRLSTALGCFALFANAHAAVTDIRWTDAGTFAQTLAVAPGKAAEVCGEIDPKDTIAWKFSADAPLEFNIHRHAWKDVIYATRSFATRELSGKFDSSFTHKGRHEWCWMWTNDTKNPAALQVLLTRE